MSEVYIRPADYTCTHVICAGEACRYIPPAIGPELPVVIQASDDVLWRRYGDSTLYYGPRNGADGLIATWREIRERAHTPPRYEHEKFPAGAWTVPA